MLFAGLVNSRGINKMQLKSSAVEKQSTAASSLFRWNGFPLTGGVTLPKYALPGFFFPNQWGGEDLDLERETLILDL